MPEGQLYRVGVMQPPAAQTITWLGDTSAGAHRPMKAEDVGDFSAVCPNCRIPLVEGISEEALARCSIHCHECKTHSVGVKLPHLPTSG